MLCEEMSTNNNWVLFEKKNNAGRRPKKNSKGEIRTLDLTGMSRALSPAELPCHILYLYRSNHSHHKPVCNSSVPKPLNYHAISIQFSSAFADSLYFCIKKIKYQVFYLHVFAKTIFLQFSLFLSA